MSSTHLPDNYADWPSLPHQILGIDSQAEKKEIRKAYAQLLRVYRPEDFPQEFNRLLDARDEMLAQLARREWEQKHQAEHPLTTESEESDSSTSTPVDYTPLSETPFPFPAESQPAPSRTLTPTLESAWDLACEGESVVAWQQLQQLVSHQPSAALRLYWLERLVPDLPVQECSRPVDWLLKYGLKLESEVVGALLQDVAANDPDFWLQDSFRDWLDSPPHALEVIPFRWKRMVQNNLPEPFSEDLDLLFSKISSSPVTWCLIALRATSTASGKKFAGISQRCFAELNQADWSQLWTPAGNIEEVYEEVRETLNKEGEPNQTAQKSWLRIMLLNLPLHPALQREFLETQFSSWWADPDTALERLVKTFQELPLLSYRGYRAVMNHVTYDQERVQAATRIMTAIVQKNRYMASTLARSKMASVSRTFLVPSEWILRNMAYGSEKENPAISKFVGEYADDLPIHFLTAAWTLYAVPEGIS